ncbi:hypothetical protein Bca52824_056192 [Brassica carinata]|uniref:mRNA cap-binding protein n=1 Tax=Brassica carinata TaxID=52824 RepID=A0A8X7QNZ7_BRACI|nr:hypothetical protein Bca52824_056192 [Brassica carinata]
MEITERRHDEIMDNVKSQYVSDERHSRARAQSWFASSTGVRNQTSYEDIIKKIVEFNTVEGFWACYCHLARTYFQYDGANCNGGKWILRFSKGVSSRFWEDLLLALVGDQLDDADNICGAVLRTSLVLLFTRSFAIKRHLKLPHAYVMEYKPHDASLRDSSSYRNTWLRG